MERGVWNGKVVGKCVHTKRGLKSTQFIKCVERVFSFKCPLFCVYWGYQSLWKMCGKGITFIDTFHTIRVLPNFAGRAGYATFPPRRPPGADCHNDRGLVCWHLGSMPKRWVPNSVTYDQNVFLIGKYYKNILRRYYWVGHQLFRHTFQMSAHSSPIIWAICRLSNKNTVPPPSKISNCSGHEDNLHMQCKMCVFANIT